MRWPTPMRSLIGIALASAMVIGCARVHVFEVRPEGLAQAIRNGLGERPFGEPDTPGRGSIVPPPPPPSDPSLVVAQARYDEARRCEHWSRDRALRLYVASMAASWGPMTAGHPRARLLYNQALEGFLRRAGGHRFRPDALWSEDLNRRGVPIVVGRGTSPREIDLLDELRFAGDYVVSGMDNFHGADGVGVPMMAIRQPPESELERRRGPERFYPFFEVHPVTAFLRFDAVGIGSPIPVLELHDPLRFDAIETTGGRMPMAADLTTPTAYHFARGRMSFYERLSLFTPQRITREAGLHMLHPYQRGKIPVVMIHGLGSSPKAWGRVVNELRGDPALRARYQFWIYMYPTGIPFMLSAADLRRSLAEARDTVDPGHTDPAYDRMLLIGHSMGGLLSKLVIAESGDALWRLNSPRPFDEIICDAEERELLSRVFFFRPLPFVRRIVFIATPHRGSRLGSELIGRIGDRLIRIPGPLEAAHAALIAANPAGSFTPEFLRGVPSSIDELTFENPYLMTINDLPLAPRVEGHSILGKVGRGPLESSSDGVIPYSSAHLDWVASETIIPGTHFLQDTRETIEELRRILRLHLDEPDSGPRAVPYRIAVLNRGRPAAASPDTRTR